jgi:phenylpyruvate tautomerase PptA (4-oxalocrotonate tautomerase family)
MPTYTVLAHPAALDADRKRALAARVTAVHSEETGAPASFVQVIYLEPDPESHYIGGEPAPAGSVHAHGHIRAGRTERTKTAVLERLRDETVAVTRLPSDLVWVYLSEIPPNQMIEFGRVLPAAGGEAAWMRALPEVSRRRLEEIGG